ncbi:hypothetical protein Back2_07800 [Nocardioides baekrokdamisoli]|uniref:Divergent 4Fe-4S mono-cluster domain-containing protein n=1 Tax=Nocardioides baekrokdamisoli TaxID=1804624 RepID=A0A3G9IVX9_9ACTN|nr:(4Fe-4S)-binding protein [Nocardioides baekrokdamisoli]BBH16493.1 hypothetical protein Back2_07800 [Nocardioides baekrokdamisoli]
MHYRMNEPVRAEIGEAAYSTTVHWRNGEFIADEPPKNGGHDVGPDPFTLLLSSLATCTLITLRMHIEKVGWDVPSIGVAVNYFTALKDGETVTTLDRDIVFTSPLTADQQVTLREVAANCPISRLLEGQVTVRTFVERTGEAEAKEYAGDGFVVEWRPDFCQHSTRCWTQLNKVFNPTERPWIHPEAAPAERIEEQVGQCPTGALKFRRV